MRSSRNWTPGTQELPLFWFRPYLEDILPSQTGPANRTVESGPKTIWLFGLKTQTGSRLHEGPNLLWFFAQRTLNQTQIPAEQQHVKILPANSRKTEHLNNDQENSKSTVKTNWLFYYCALANCFQKSAQRSSVKVNEVRRIYVFKRS